MDFFASLFVEKPQNILIVASIFLLAYLLLRFIAKNSSLYARPLLILFVIWGIYALWEWIVQMQTPEANIRVDLLIIWPILAILTVWKLFGVFRHKN